MESEIHCHVYKSLPAIGLYPEIDESMPYSILFIQYSFLYYPLINVYVMLVVSLLTGFAAK
jgi:hypothetical protein